MDDDLSPTKIGRIDVIEPRGKNLQETIIEESSDIHSLNNKKNYLQKRLILFNFLYGELLLMNRGSMNKG